VPDSITVTGHGAATGTPDIVVLRVGAEAMADSPVAAFDAASRSVAAMLAALRQDGLADRDLQTSGASVEQWRESSSGVHYRGSQQLTATVRDIESVGSLVGTVIEAGGEAARLHGLSLSFSDTDAMLRVAREAAWDDAVARAQQYVELAGRRLGNVMRITEGSHGAPIMRRHVRREPAATELSFSMPMESGERELTATVEVEWALAD
jgi:uncharacterized protein